MPIGALIEACAENLVVEKASELASTARPLCQETLRTWAIRAPFRIIVADRRHSSEIQASEIREHLALHENAISCTYEEANAELKGRDISDHTAKVIAVTCKQGPEHPPSNG